MKRRYDTLLSQQLAENSEMIFLAGPRQVGKTTTSLAFEKDIKYINWDNEDDRGLILQGPKAVAGVLGTRKFLVFDEIHKFTGWKNFLKGFFDTYGRDKLKIVVTGSARLDIYQKGGDSLMGRYFLHRMHPLTVGELLNQTVPEKEISSPGVISDESFQALLKYGGFPKPFLKADKRFHTRWKNARSKLLFREDLRDLTKIQEVGQVELVAEFLKQQAGQLTSYAFLARKVRASEDSIRRWVTVLESLYYCFTIRPWSNNVARSLLKEPKIFLWDWSALNDPGARFENFVASHLLKAIHWWNDCGFGDFGLYFLRTKEKREVDFLVTRDKCPWFMVEAKLSTNSNMSKHLTYFHQRLETRHAFQVVADLPGESRINAFDFDMPVKISANSFLSHLA